ncbi:SIR2 family protein [Sporolactobacillus shoreae]|uniref:SIR2 family protein n=1 Tax=Sporolactobacillus shoreae TaxID=1465501 RepID=A0A4Z0GQ90_9BACL|nr:SIR2 family protein [Sporolactobacillus shoreae]TGA98257.1 SIR2 family protein [Sporolactobacillus shoreae]
MQNENIHSYIKDIANHLWQPTIYGHASVMVGAGFSKNAISSVHDKSLPNWGELSLSIFDRLYTRDTKTDVVEQWNTKRVGKTFGRNALNIAEEFRVTFGRSALDKLIEINLPDLEYQPGPLHTQLLELPWNDVFTTNYDTLLERTISKINIKNRKNYKIVRTQNDLPGSTRPRIIKLHGSMPTAKPYIITEEDYRTYPKKFAPFVNTVQQAMLETQLCLIGFSGDDPNFTSWLGWLRDNMQENCPKIYLCGVFDDLNSSEKKLLEQRNIVIVDIGSLIKGETSNRYSDALVLFFKELKENKITTKDIYQLPKELDNLKHLISKIRSQNRIWSRYAALPEKIRAKASLNLDAHLDKVLSDKTGTYEDRLLYVSELCQRKCHCLLPFTNKQITQLEELINHINDSKENDNEASNTWAELCLSLCLNYRQNNLRDRYIRLMDKLEHKLNEFNEEVSMRFFLEKSIFALQSFDYIESLKWIRRIGSTSPIVIRIKKCCILSQLGLEKDAKQNLKEISMDVAQQFMPKEVYASLIGYINLCYRSLGIWENNEFDIFSDNESLDSKYNTRNILNGMQEILFSKLQDAEGKDKKITKSFSPNTFVHHFGTGSKEVTEARTASFQYLNLIDSLCLPVFGDHKSSIFGAIQHILENIKCPYWEWFYIIQFHDKDYYDRFFTRSYVTFCEKGLVEPILNNLILLLKIFNTNEDFNRSRKILTEKEIINLASRFALHANKAEINLLLEKFVEINNKGQIANKYEIEDALNNFSYAFDKEKLIDNLELILSSPYNGLHLSSHFNSVKGLPEDLVKKYFPEILANVSSLDLSVRDEAILRLLLIKKSHTFSEHESEIATSVCSNLKVPHQSH